VGEKKNREFMTYDELKDHVLNWSWDTVKRRIENDGFPAMKVGNRFMFDPEKVRLWMKKREIQN